ncbi:DUF6766 family protein [Actinokineospora sp. NPDC004072]
MRHHDTDDLARVGKPGQGVEPFGKPRFAKAYSFALVTGVFFLLSWIGQFIFQYMAFRQEQQTHGEEAAFSDYFPQFAASTLENWQSEFLQLIWQAAGLALFYYWGSSQSRESDERMEAKLDALLAERGIDPGGSPKG